MWRLLDFEERGACEQWSVVDDRMLGGKTRADVFYRPAGSVSGVRFKPACRFEGSLASRGFATAFLSLQGALEGGLKGAEGIALRGRSSRDQGKRLTLALFGRSADGVSYEQRFNPQPPSCPPSPLTLTHPPP